MAAHAVPNPGIGPSASGQGAGSPKVSPIKRPVRAVVTVVLIGLVLTAATAWSTLLLDHHNEQHLLDLQTEQVGEVLSAAIPTTVGPLSTALQIANATSGNDQKFVDSIAAEVGPNKQFDTVSLWRDEGGELSQVVRFGPSKQPSSTDVRGTIEAAISKQSLVIRGLFGTKQRRIAYADATPRGPAIRYAIYADRAIPPSKKTVIASNSAFSDLNFAIYLGKKANTRDLLASTFAHLPASGRSDTISVPFGTTFLTVIVAPAGQLTGALAASLPWIFAALGTLLSVLAGLTTDRVVHRRMVAERDAAVIRKLYGELDQLYGQQRGIAETLQTALLPARIPKITGLEIAVRYVAGARGVEVGGDWYSVVHVDDGRFAFVVGDVSGRGISAATVMGSLRYTIRAYAYEGHDPTEILELCDRHVPILDTGHFATVLVGMGDIERQEVTIANAGHLNPLLLDNSGSRFLQTKVGLPLGLPNARYEATTFALKPGSTLVAFTDGLVERRGENIDTGLARLERTAQGTDLEVDSLLTKIVSEFNDDGSEDDIVLLGIRWLNTAVSAQ